MAKPANAYELRQKLAQLKAERTPLEPLYKQLKKYVLPDSGRFDTKQDEDSDTGYEYLADATATEALDTLGAGMLGGMTSPARQWFRLTVSDQDLESDTSVKGFLSDLQKKMLSVFAKSNVYQALNTVYLELATYGTACVIALPSRDRVIHLHVMTAGEYWLAENSEHRVDTMYREMRMTARQIVERFGIDNVSKRVADAYRDPGRCFTTFTVIHCIEPRPDWDPTKRSNKEMPYRSVYFEETGDAYYSTPSIEDAPHNGKDRVLLEEGFAVFPVLAPRWTLSPLSPYGRSPAMKALLTIRALQEETNNYEKAVDLMVNPPLLVPTSFANHPLDLGPGGVSYVDLTNGQSVTAAVATNFDINAAREGIQDKRQRINDYFFKDLFLMLEQTARYGRTAYEVEKLEKEKMMVMGPVLERLHSELLDPLIAATIRCMATAGKLPALPDSMRGADSAAPLSISIGGEEYANEEDAIRLKEDLNIEYVSVLAQAQRAAGVDAMAQYVQSLAGAMQVWPDVVDNFDYDKWADVLADQLGVDPDLIRSDENIQAIRDQRAQAQQQMQQMQQAQQMAGTAKDVSQAIPADSSIEQTMRMMSGY